MPFLQAIHYRYYMRLKDLGEVPRGEADAMYGQARRIGGKWRVGKGDPRRDRPWAFPNRGGRERFPIFRPRYSRIGDRLRCIAPFIGPIGGAAGGFQRLTTRAVPAPSRPRVVAPSGTVPWGTHSVARCRRDCHVPTRTRGVSIRGESPRWPRRRLRSRMGPAATWRCAIAIADSPSGRWCTCAFARRRPEEI